MTAWNYQYFDPKSFLNITHITEPVMIDNDCEVSWHMEDGDCI